MVVFFLNRQEISQLPKVKQYMRQYLRDKVNRNLTIKEGRIEIAKNFLSMGLSAEDVSKGAEISLQEVKKLKKELTNE